MARPDVSRDGRDDSFDVPAHTEDDNQGFDGAVDLDVTMDPEEETEVPEGSRKDFVEFFEGSGETFPGGKSFLDDFRQDEHAAERRDNLYFPFASHDEWQLASWLLRSRLSISALDSLLSLNIVGYSFTL